ncbi:hypothetical protein SAMN04488689_102719 [Paenibacillus sp. cl6col]|nr:two-component sensor histidine kinase [Paenibacillus alvei A6-6i-x]SDE82145.1 hypothetical protein SAMN04488689_102719 [Paenibacillus sp. cl6col]
MSIRVKLLLSYTAMLIISLSVFFLIAGLFTTAATGDIHSIRDFYKVHYQLNPLTEQEESIFLGDDIGSMRVENQGAGVNLANSSGVTPLQHAKKTWVPSNG